VQNARAKWQISLFATQKEENDWANTPNQGALRCVPAAFSFSLFLSLSLSMH
jgi:hypothetical protein